MKYHYKALFSEPGSADLVYARLKQKYPDMEIHISESDYPQNTRIDAYDTEFGSEVSFTMLAPLTVSNHSPAETVNLNNTGITPSPYGTITARVLHDSTDSIPTIDNSAVIYGCCDISQKSVVTQNLRRYGADSVMTSTQDF